MDSFAFFFSTLYISLNALPCSSKTKTYCYEVILASCSSSSLLLVVPDNINFCVNLDCISAPCDLILSVTTSSLYELLSIYRGAIIHMKYFYGSVSYSIDFSI